MTYAWNKFSKPEKNLYCSLFYSWSSKEKVKNVARIHSEVRERIARKSVELDKRQNRETCYFYIGGSRILNLHSTECLQGTRHHEGSVVSALVPEAVPPIGLAEKITLMSQSYVIQDASEQGTGLTQGED